MKTILQQMRVNRTKFINKCNKIFFRDCNDLYEDQQILTEQIMMALNINRNLIH